MVFHALDDQKQLVQAEDAKRESEYHCLECKEIMILKRGKIIRPHFSHKADNNKSCSNSEGESYQHNFSKYKLKELLENERKIKIRKSSSCLCGYSKRNKIDIILLKPEWEIKVEYLFDEKYHADVAVLENDTIKYIFEIYYKHKTINPRPGEWYEISAEEILESKEIFNCIRERKHECDTCKLSKYNYNIVPLTWKYGIERGWKQNIFCLSCRRTTYAPIFNKSLNRYLPLCMTCNKHNFMKKLNS